MDMYQIVVKPLVTEKGTTMLSEGNWVTFKVHMDANKIEIRDAIQKIFTVSVLVSLGGCAAGIKLGEIPGKYLEYC